MFALILAEQIKFYCRLRGVPIANFYPRTFLNTAKIRAQHLWVLTHSVQILPVLTQILNVLLVLTQMYAKRTSRNVTGVPVVNMLYTMCVLYTK